MLKRLTTSFNADIATDAISDSNSRIGSYVLRDEEACLLYGVPREMTIE